ncbi:inositol monophosphatase [Candidatus Woesearchaeota archaeon]|nr:inositol monophosphatase [Candidatus Woesearchaeota archaeon]
MKLFTIALAKRAGAYLLKHFKENALLVKERGLGKEISTIYDKESDRMIVQAIEQRFPSHNLLTEESGFVDKKSEYTWYVDSLDGTGNFALGNPFFAVSIALAKKEELVLAAVYAPFLQERYVAEAGKGAFLNGKQVHISDVQSLSTSYIVTCEGAAKSNVRLAKFHASLHPHVKDMRKLGSAALECCFVASGRADAYVTFTIPPYDVAAGVLIVQEAGGVTTDFSGKLWKCGSQSDIVLSNGLVHKELVARLKNF